MQHNQSQLFKQCANNFAFSKKQNLVPHRNRNTDMGGYHVYTQSKMITLLQEVHKRLRTRNSIKILRGNTPGFPHLLLHELEK